MVNAILHIDVVYNSGYMYLTVVQAKNLPTVSFRLSNFVTNKETILNIGKQFAYTGGSSRKVKISTRIKSFLIEIKKDKVSNITIKTGVTVDDINSLLVLKKVMTKRLQELGVMFTFNISSDVPIQAYSIQHDKEYNTLRVDYEGLGVDKEEILWDNISKTYEVKNIGESYIVKDKTPNGIGDFLNHIQLNSVDPYLYYVVPMFIDGHYTYMDLNITINFVSNDYGFFTERYYLNKSILLKSLDKMRDGLSNTVYSSISNYSYIYKSTIDKYVYLNANTYYVRKPEKLKTLTIHRERAKLKTYNQVIEEVEQLELKADNTKQSHCRIKYNIYLNGEKMNLEQLKDNKLRFAWFNIMESTREGVGSYLRYYIRISNSKHFDITHNGQVYSVFVNRQKSGVYGNKIFLKYNVDEVDGYVIDNELLANTDIIDKILNKMVDLYPNLHNTKLQTLPSYKQKPTIHAVADDFIFKAGIEFETAMGGVDINYGESMTDKHSGFYSYGPDGGGIEVRSTIMENPNLFSIIGRFDSFCKTTRNLSDYGTCYEAGTHIHISTTPKEVGNNAWNIENQMLRRRLLANNLFSTYMKYDTALAFFDTFNPGSRRQSYYGLAISANKDKVFTNDSRYSQFNQTTVTDIFSAFCRNSLLRTSPGGSLLKHLHWEWRGTDLCMSALFMGLKVELLKAINNKALELTLNGDELPMWDVASFNKVMSLHKNVKHVSELTNKVFRQDAKKMVKELKDYMPSYAFRGLMAWATFVDITDESTGLPVWYEKYEAIIIKNIGVRYFITEEQVDDLFEPVTKGNTVKIPKENLSLFDAELAERYQVIFGDSSNTYRAYEYDSDGDNYCKWDTVNSCSSCKTGLYRTTNVYRGNGFSLCEDCYNTYGTSIITKEHGTFTDRINGNTSIKKAESLVYNTFK